MRRRKFISCMAAQALAFSSAGTVWAMGENRKGEHYSVSLTKRKQLTKIGTRTLEEIRDIFREELYEKTIPLWKEKGVDREYGGYLPYINDKGEITSTQKLLYHQGRVLWLYSYFFNHFDRDEYHLKAAKTGYDFLTKYCMDDNYDWYTEVTREGKAVTRFFDIYASIYMILGLGEYYRATGFEEARDLAVKSAYRVTEIILSPHYQAQGHGTYYEPGTKRLGTWLHLLSTLTPLLKYTEDQGIEKIARMCVRYILQYHWQPELGLAFEILQPNFKPHPNDYFIDESVRTFHNQAREVNNFHTMEAAWMIMDEALRVGNPEMFIKGMEFGRSHLEKSWVDRDSESGLVQFFRPDEPDSFAEGEICRPYVMKEIFILLLLALEHNHARWAAEWFDRVFSYSYEKPLIWPYRDTLHQPRGVMFSLEILDRMIERKGRVSDFFEKG